MKLTYVRDIWLPGQSPRFPMQCWSNQLWLTSLIYLTDIFEIHGISSSSTILSWQSSIFTFFCALFVQFGQHTVSHQGMGLFLPIGYLLSQTENFIYGFFNVQHLLWSRFVRNKSFHCQEKPYVIQIF